LLKSYTKQRKSNKGNVADTHTQYCFEHNQLIGKYVNILHTIFAADPHLAVGEVLREEPAENRETVHYKKERECQQYRVKKDKI
jgi:hypothetical protein